MPMFTEDNMMDEEMMEDPMGELQPAGAPPQAQPMGMRQFYGNQIGLGSPATTVSPEELSDLLGPAPGEGYSDYGAAPEFGAEAPTPLGADISADMGGAAQDPNALLADLNSSSLDPEQVKRDIRAILLQRAQDRMRLSEAYQDQSDELGEGGSEGGY